MLLFLIKTVAGQSVLGVNFLVNNRIKKIYSTHNYDRLGITIIGGKAIYPKSKFYESPTDFFQTPYENHLFSKFDYTRVSLTLDDIDIPKKRKDRKGLSKSKFLKLTVENRLQNANSGREIIKKINQPWRTNGSSPYAPAEVMRRFNLNVTNNDLNRVKPLRHNISSSNFIDSLYNVYKDNYIVVHTFKKIQKMSEVYARRRFAVNAVFTGLTFGLVRLAEMEPERVDFSDGWKVKGESFLFRVKVKNKQIDNILKNYRNQGDISIIDRQNIPVEFVESVKFRMKKIVLNTGNYPNNLEEVKDVMSDDLHRLTIGKFENKVVAFQLKRMVEAGRPLRIEVGRKEGVRLNQRFLVFQEERDNNGNRFNRPVGAVRISKIADNSESLTALSKRNELSTVIQYQGKPLTGGEFVKEWNDHGVAFGYRYSTFTAFMPGFHSVDMTVDLSKITGLRNLNIQVGSNSNLVKLNLNHMIGIGLLSLPNKQGSFYYLPPNNTDANYNFSRVQIMAQEKSPFIGLSRLNIGYNYSFLHNFYVRPSIGIRGFTFSFEDNATLGYGNSSNYYSLKKIEMNGFVTSMDLGFYISPSISIFGSYSHTAYNIRYFGTYKPSVGESQISLNTVLSFGINIEL